MATRSRTSFQKRQKEIARMEKQRDKAAKRAQRKLNPTGSEESEYVLGEDGLPVLGEDGQPILDRKSTRLNSSHLGISYAVFCLKKKKMIIPLIRRARFFVSPLWWLALVRLP